MSRHVVTRFAPSPTGHLHLGGARTALFNWLYAKHNNGKFLLRIEDTDKKRSSKELIDSIIDAMAWLKISYDGEVVLQSNNISKHVEVVNRLILNNKAYYCYCSDEDISREKEEANKRGLYYKHNCVWKDKNTLSNSISRVVRLRTPTEGTTSFNDEVYGNVTVNNVQLDDMILLRSDNTPTYLLSVVVDDHDMNITHIIRGTDHLTNTARQLLIYNALNWEPPKFAHIPLIHDQNGNKLSKRHQALGIHEYKNSGILPEAVFNYLLRMGWSHDNDEIITMDQAVKWFSIENIGQSPSRLDNKKLEFLNNYYINITDDNVILNMIIPIIEEKVGHAINDIKKGYLLKGLSELKKRTKTLLSLADESLFYVEDTPRINQEAIMVIKDHKNILSALHGDLSEISREEWDSNILTLTVKNISQSLNIKIGTVYRCLRASIVGRMNAPSIIEIMVNFQQEESLRRIRYLLDTI